MSDFEKTCHLELAPEVDILQNGRRRVTRRFELGKNGNIDDVIFAAYGDADPATITACTTGYSNLKLIAQKVQPQQRGPSLLVQVFETLTNAFVAETDDVEDYDTNGLKKVTRTLIALPGTSTAAFIVSTQTYGSSPTTYLARLKVENTDAYTRVVAEYLQAGVVSRSIRQIGGGLREESISSFKTRVAPTNGLITDDRVDNELGFPTYVVTAKQTSTGADPLTAGVVLSVGLETQFEYPGRCAFKRNHANYGGSVNFEWTDLYMSPPVSALVDATVEVRYAYRSGLAAADVVGTAATDTITLTAHGLPAGWPVHFSEVTGGFPLVKNTTYFISSPTTNTFQLASTEGGASLDFTTNITAASLVPYAKPRWNPDRWAVLSAIYLLYNDVDGARSKLEGLRGYRVEQPEDDVVPYQAPSPASPQTVDIGSEVLKVAVAFGSLCLSGYGGMANLYGGPAKPGGLVWTLSAKPEEAFVDAAGARVYRHTIISAYIPEQEALPADAPYVPPS